MSSSKREIRDELWTVQECASRLNITAATWRSYVSRGNAAAPRPVRHIGSTPLWDATEVLTWNSARPGKGGRPKRERRSS
jgi:hypothetical protein